MCHKWLLEVGYLSLILIPPSLTRRIRQGILLRMKVNHVDEEHQKEEKEVQLFPTLQFFFIQLFSKAFQWALIEIMENTYQLTISVRVPSTFSSSQMKGKEKFLLQEVIEIIDTLLEVSRRWNTFYIRS
jgi:hypothetical protein